MSERRKQRFILEIPAPLDDEAELVEAWEVQRFLLCAVKLMRENGMPQDTDSLYYAKLDELTVVGK